MFPITAKFNEKGSIGYKLVIGIEPARTPETTDPIERGILGLFSFLGGVQKNTNIVTTPQPENTVLVLAETSDGYNRRVTVSGSLESVREKIETSSHRKEPYVDLTAGGSAFTL